MRVTGYPRVMIAAAILVVLVSVAAPCDAQERYLDLVSSALDSLEVGQSPESLADLRSAVAMNAADPLAYAALGVTLLYGGRSAEALQEFERAKERGAQAEADYGAGLVLLAKGNLAESIGRFIQVQAAQGPADAQASIEYVKSLTGGAYPQVAADSEDDSLRAIAADVLMRQQRFAEAADVLETLRPSVERVGMGERIGCSMTFDAKKPVSFTGWPINGSYVSPAAIPANLQKVSGSVTLRADLTKAGKVDMVTFYVDDRFVGMTNVHPFTYSWDTTTFANGAHVVKIQGFFDGLPTSEKTLEVAVVNAADKTRVSRITGDRADELWRRVWAAMLLKPGTSAVYYNLGLCAIEAGDLPAAAGAFERVLAADPDYLDAADRLAGMSRAGHARLSLLGTGRKAIALTFDDGPKDRTGELLDVLARAGVKATFFVVGKQAEANPDLLRRMAAEGHDIQNHTYGHRALDLIPEREIYQEIYRTSAVVRSITGKGTRYVRPPGGREGKRLPEVMRKQRLGTVFWSINCGNVEGTTQEKLVQHVVSEAQPGAIVLMHNVEMVTLLALPEIVSRLRAMGYEFVTISEAAGAGV